MSIIYFIIALSAIVVVHELGHFATAKFFKVYCKEFSWGFGPTLLKYQGKETKYSIRALPFGGYVSMAGEEGVDSENVPVERTITGIKKFKRVIIMLAGIVLNIILAWRIFVGYYLIKPEVMIIPKAVIKEVMPGSPAEKAGILPGDLIDKVILADNTKVVVRDFYELADVLGKSEGEITIILTRNSEVLKYTVTPIYSAELDRNYIGITNIDPTYRTLKVGECFSEGTYLLKDVAGSMLDFISGLFVGKGYNQLSGPIGIYEATDESAKAGLSNYILIIGLLSLNVAFFNLLPLPILDGGRVVLILIEAVIKRPINKKIETGLMMVSLGMLFLLIGMAFFNDLSRILG